MPDPTRGTILLTGGTGYLGSLLAATALRETDATLVLPVRSAHTPESVVRRIASEAAAGGQPLGEADVARLVVVPLPPIDRLHELDAALAGRRIDEIVHCAGCLSYFNVRRLRSGNVDLTRGLLDLGARLGVQRFVFVSTAYTSGFVDGPIPEALHAGDRDDPTDYTSTKRAAEWLVAESGLPYVIVRPSIVIGDSRHGRYGGRTYGPYQIWAAGGKYLPDGFPRVLHVVAARQPVNFLHQDAFTSGFWAAHRNGAGNGVVHLASRENGLPSMRDLWQLWFTTYGGPSEVHFFEHLDDVPLDEVDPRMRLFLDFTAVNSEIASSRWQFRLDTLERLRDRGTAFADATIDTLQVVQDRYVRDSPTLQRFLARHGSDLTTPRIVTHAASS